MSEKHNEFAKEMVEKCPLLYGDIVEKVSLQSSLMCFKFEIGSGWFGLVRDLSIKLEKNLQEMSEESRCSNRAFQVK